MQNLTFIILAQSRLTLHPITNISTLTESLDNNVFNYLKQVES